MPIINQSVKRILAAPAPLSSAQKDNLRRWLAVINGRQFPKIFNVQLEMVRELMQTEKNIQRLRSEREALLSGIPAFKAGGDMDGIRALQAKAQQLQEEIESWQQYWHSIKLIGDTMALALVDIDLIKQFALQQQPGYVSGKDGLASELKAATHFAELGYFVLLNDLTNCLKAGDLTVMKGDKLYFHEVKKEEKAYQAAQKDKQTLVPALAKNFVETDVTVMQAPGEKPGVAVRLDHPVDEDYQLRIGGVLLKDLGRSEVRVITSGSVTYLVTKRPNVGALAQKLEDLTRTGDWVVASLEGRLRRYGDTPAFTKWLKTEPAIEVMGGELIILTAISMEGYRALLNGHGLDITWKQNGSDCPTISYAGQRDPYVSFLKEMTPVGFVQQWRWERVLYGFYSIKSFVELIAHSFSGQDQRQGEEKRKAFEDAGRKTKLKTISLQKVPKNREP